MAALERFLTLFLFGWGSAGAIFSFFNGKELFSPEIEIYFSGIIFVFFLALLFTETKYFRWKLSTKEWNEIQAFLFFFFLMLVFRISLVHQIPIWLDEDYQVSTAIRQMPVAAAASQHQPPFEFILINSIVRLFGLTELTGRFSACLFSSAAAGLLAVQLRRITGHWVIAVLGVLFYSLHGIVTQYGYEARPLSIGMFTIIIFCSFLVPLLKRAMSWGEGVYLAAICLCSLLAIGMQPVVVIGGACVALAVAPVSLWKNRLRIVFAVSIGVLAFTPVQLYILRISTPRISRTKPFTLEFLWAEVTSANFSYYLSVYITPLLPLLLALLLCFLFSCFFKKKEKPTLSHSFYGLLLFGLTAFLFLAFLIPYFKGYIEWPLQAYYLLAVWPLSFFFLAHGIQFVEERWKMSGLGRWPVWVPLFSVTAILSLVYPNAYKNYIPNPPSRDNTRAFFSAINEFDGKKVAILNFCLASGNKFCPWLIGEQFYMKLKHVKAGGQADFPSEEFENSDMLTWLPRFFQSDWEPEWLAIVLYNSWDGQKLKAAMLPEGYLLREFEGIQLFLFPLQGKPARQAIVDFFESLAKRVPKGSPGRFGLLPVLTLGNHYLGKKERARAYSQEIVHDQGFSAGHLKNRLQVEGIYSFEP